MYTDQLWGGVLDDVTLDVPHQTATLAISVTHSGRSVRHVLCLGDILELRFFNSIPGLWDYAEITEIHFRRDVSTKVWAFEFLLWSEAGLSGRCSSVTLDGAELVLDT